MAKGMGGGLPLGAIVTTDELSKVIEKGMHGTTYGGNALACVAGIVVMEELKMVCNIMQKKWDVT